ncbi:MAG: 50S ribosomal protein L23 [Patescibacteria group bacterium]|nr:50S ribosomal protein L23 [Patescibacteria group bacterium]MBU2509479.1 50S ribosomal protein L23 [Patescibacteria group bacterium]
MGIFDRLRQKKAALPKAAEDEFGSKKEIDKVADIKKAEIEKLAKKGLTEKTKVLEKPKVAVNGPSGQAYRILLTPHVSEKAAELASKGTYVFDVPITVNKIEIQKAVESLYKVDVDQVRTVRGIGKVVRFGRTHGQRAKWKKALVTLKKGQKIDLYEGV